jgi:hypothetical protein
MPKIDARQQRFVSFPLVGHLITRRDSIPDRPDSPWNQWVRQSAHTLGPVGAVGTYLVSLPSQTGPPSRKRQTRREAGTQSHGSGLRSLMAGLPRRAGAFGSSRVRGPRTREAPYVELQAFIRSAGQFPPCLSEALSRLSSDGSIHRPRGGSRLYLLGRARSVPRRADCAHRQALLQAADQPGLE